MITKFQTPAGAIEALPEEEKLKVNLKNHQIVEYPDQIYSPEIPWTQEDVMNTIQSVKNAVQSQYNRIVEDYGVKATPSSVSRFKGAPGKINPAPWLMNWYAHRGDLMQKNLNSTSKLNELEDRGNASENIISTLTKALTSYPNPNDTPNQQLDHALYNSEPNPAVDALAKRLNLSNPAAEQKYRDIMQFRYNNKINPRQRNMSIEQINNYINQDASGVFDNMTDDQKQFIFNDLAYNEKRNEGTAFAKQGKKLIPRRKKGKLC